MVVVSSFARFHADRLASQMARLRSLSCVYTSYPRPFAGVPREQISTIPGLFPLSYAVERVWPALAGRVSRVCSRAYDHIVARALLACPGHARGRVLHAWATFSLTTLHAARRTGLLTFLESSCPHPRPRGRLLREEASRMGERWTTAPGWEETICAEFEAADYVVVPSAYTYRSFVEERFPAEKLVQVPLGVDLKEAPVDLPPKPSRFTVLMVGTDPVRKGAYYLLRAWKLLRIPDATLVIRSGIPRAARELAAGPNVECIPPVSRKELLALYRRATVFCFPSVDDGFGLVVLEAMAHGLPVIVTPHVGAADVVRSGVDGFIVPIRDPEALAERIEFFYRNRDAVETLGRNARERAQAYSWDRYGEAILANYMAALDGRALRLPQ